MLLPAAAESEHGPTAFLCVVASEYTSHSGHGNY